MKISIITVNLNNKLGLEKTLKSISLQPYKHIEIIVVDGKSTDGSNDIIEKNKSIINKLVIEKDNGVYDAMNKGISLATGNYIIFMNSGDTFNHYKVLENFVSYKPQEDFVYGDVLVILRSGKKRVKKMPKDLNAAELLTTTITHQAIFHKKEVFKIQKYNLEYKIIADWVFYVDSILFRKSTFRHINLTISNFESGGLSSNLEEISKERNIFLNSIMNSHSIEILKEYSKLENLLNNNIVLKNSLVLLGYYKKFKSVFT